MYTPSQPNIPSSFFRAKHNCEENAPEHINIKRKIHSFNPFNWIEVARSINDLKPDYVIFRYCVPLSWHRALWHCPKINKNIKKIFFVDNWIPHETKLWTKPNPNVFKSNEWCLPLSQLQLEIKFHPISLICPYGRGFIQ